jgi:pimeloyl-ACP methyl ester carboxylesterase
MIVRHGWPGSVIEQLKIIGPLTNPEAHGGHATDVFHIVVPSLPGYGFSGKPAAAGWVPERVARTWTALMKRRGFGRNWGGRTAGTQDCSASTPALPGAVPTDLDKAALAGALTGEQR